MLYFDGFFDGIILKHEAGHFAGLWHTSEFSPGLVDPLDDTPPCEDVNSQFEGCPDYDYIMFPTGGSGEGFLSPRQSAVIHGSAIYRGSYAAGEAPMPPYGPPLPQGKKASVSDLDAARARASTLRTQRSMADQIGSWANTVPVGVAHHLAGIGCPEGADASAMGGYFAQLNELGATNASVMLDIATDESAPAHVRRRAIGMAARLVEGGATAPGMNAAFEALALDADGARLVRSAALRGLARVSASDARRVAGALEHELDPVIARAVKSVR
jgi:hypothetical protein